MGSAINHTIFFTRFPSQDLFDKMQDFRTTELQKVLKIAFAKNFLL